MFKCQVSKKCIKVIYLTNCDLQRERYKAATLAVSYKTQWRLYSPFVECQHFTALVLHITPLQSLYIYSTTSLADNTAVTWLHCRLSSVS